MSGLADFRAKYPQYSDVPDQDLADRLYAKHYSDMPRGEFDRKMGLGPSSDPVVDGAGQLVRGINRGLHSMAALPGEIIGGAVSMAGFPETGEAMRLKGNPVSDFMTSPDVQPETTLGRYANATGQAIGASAVPTGALVANAPRLAAMVPQSTMGAVSQQIGQGVAAAPRAAIAADAAAATGGAIGSQAARDEGYGPGTQAVAGIAGAMVPGLAAAGVSRAIQPVRRAMAEQGESGAYSSIIRDIDGGADAITRDVAMGQGPGGVAGINRQNTLRVLGEEMTATGGNVQQAEARTIQRMAQEYSLTPQTAAGHLRDLRGLHADNPLMLGEQPSISASDNALRGPAGGLRRAQNVDLDELKQVQDSAVRGKFDYLASSGNAPSAVNTRNALIRRQDTLAENFRSALGRIQQAADSQGRSLNIQDAENLITSASQSASRAYEAAYNSPIDNRVMVQTLPRLLQRFERQAMSRAGDVQEAMLNASRQFYSQTPNGPVAMMTLRQLQDARTRLRELREGYRQSQDYSLARPLNQLYDQITALMTRMSPQWGQANRQWADMELDSLGTRLGDAFSKTPGPRYREQLRQFRNLNPQAQDIVRVHYVQKLLDDLDRAKDTHSIAKFFTSDQSRNAIRTILGDRAAVDFTRTVRNINAAEKTFQMNSRTHIRGEVKAQEEAFTGLEAARRGWSLSAMRDAVIDRLGQVLTERKNRPMADVLTTPMSNTPRVAMHIDRMRRQEARLRALAQPRVRPVPLSGIYGGQQYEE